MNWTQLLRLRATSFWRLYLLPIVQVFTSKSLTALADIAYAFVIEASTNPDFVDGNGDDRRKWVADQLKKNDFVTGNKIADNLINIAIELAVARLKNEKK